MAQTPPETREVDGRKLFCNGGGNGAGHPLVWLQIPADPGWVDCPYCNCRYVCRIPAKAAG